MSVTPTILLLKIMLERLFEVHCSGFNSIEEKQMFFIIIQLLNFLPWKEKEEEKNEYLEHNKIKWNYEEIEIFAWYEMPRLSQANPVSANVHFW